MSGFVVSQELLEKTLSYLAGRPYIEVAGLIQQLSQCKPLPHLEMKSDESGESQSNENSRPA